MGIQLPYAAELNRCAGVYTGFMKMGVRDGQGTMKCDNGLLVRQDWRDGILMKEVKLNITPYTLVGQGWCRSGSGGNDQASLCATRHQLGSDVRGLVVALSPLTCNNFNIEGYASLSADEAMLICDQEPNCQGFTIGWPGAKVRLNSKITTTGAEPTLHCWKKTTTTTVAHYEAFGVSAALAWDAAKAACAALGKQLAVPQTAAQNVDIQQACASVSAAECWVGGTTTSQNMITWLGLGNSNTYTQWDSGEPNGVIGECVGIYSSNGVWNDRTCTDSMPYVCGPTTTTTAK